MGPNRAPSARSKGSGSCTRDTVARGGPHAVAPRRLRGLALALPTASAAAKVCLADATNQFLYQFGKLKVPKKTDVATPVVGLAFSATSANALPLSGALIRDGSTGKLYLGFTRFFQECIVTAVLEDTLSGTVSYDCNLDGANDGSFELTLASCP